MDNYKQVRIAIFNSEPLAKLAEQQLYASGVPCLLKGLNGGPGIWGSAYNLPHGLYVYEQDANTALEILALDTIKEEYDAERDSSRSLISILIFLMLVIGLVILLSGFLTKII